MNGLFRETVFGRIVHLASGGKLFQTEEQRDPSRLQRYMLAKSASTSDESIKTAIEVPALRTRDAEKDGSSDTLCGDNVDAEKGSDYELIDWLENDSEV
jgi:hypothetical protein